MSIASHDSARLFDFDFWVPISWLIISVHQVHQCNSTILSSWNIAIGLRKFRLGGPKMFKASSVIILSKSKEMHWNKPVVLKTLKTFNWQYGPLQVYIYLFMLPNHLLKQDIPPWSSLFALFKGGKKTSHHFPRSLTASPWKVTWPQ